ncbi:hypothetical protein [Pseudooceanicola aestuarii]|uniref:hypothetical protein n=1 Tax=Pseudooceanicola aestuarii TaxID=2697319 RepID=UPI0013CFE959|nr:hypothetical protein [Pseudooceanicola aestuarii]
MLYLILLAGVLLLCLRPMSSGRASAVVLAGMAALLLYLWGAYFAWDNPSGDPQGSMYRGLELWTLLALTALFAGAVGLRQARRATGRRNGGDGA